MTYSESGLVLYSSNCARDPELYGFLCYKQQPLGKARYKLKLVTEWLPVQLMVVSYILVVSGITLTVFIKPCFKCNNVTLADKDE